MAYTTIDTNLLGRVASGIEDADIAKILGIRLNHDLSDLPKLQRIHDYRESFLESLENEVYRLERLETAMIGTAERVVRASVNNDVKTGVRYNALNTRFGDAGLDVKTEYVPGGIAFHVTANRVVGKEGRGNATDRDLRYLQEVFVDSSTIPLDSVDGLTIARDGSPIIKPLRETEEPLRTLLGQRKATHLVQIQYSATIPTDMLVAVYEKHKGG